MARCVRVLSAEARTERIYSAESQAVSFYVQLSRNRQIGLPAEEIFRKIHITIKCKRRLPEVERGHPERLPRSLAIAGGDDRSMDPQEPVLVEETVDRHRHHV